MSNSVEVCIKYAGTEELKAEVESILGLALTHYESPSPGRTAYYGGLLTIDVSLSVNYPETDGEMNFSDFQYFLATRVAGHICAQQLLELQLPLTDTIGLLLSHYLGAEVMVTIEAQELHAGYHPV